MAKSKKREPLPVRASTHTQEDDSREIFGSAIKPWMVFSWIPKDYGIDAIIEITIPISRTKHQIVTGKRFTVQLKSTYSDESNATHVSLNVPIEKINYWISAIEPVMIVLVNLNQKVCYFRWIDENLVNELYQTNEHWIANKSVTIRFNKESVINTKQLLPIEEHVIHWRRPSKMILTPGNYFRYSTEAVYLIDTLIEKISAFNISFLKNEILDLKRQFTQSIYTIAIAGPSRSGKSTLINALLHKDVSPMGILPTTGVPITIFPDNQNKSTIVFKNGTELTGTIESSFLKEYTSQDDNPDNKKKVKLVTVNIINALLEKGFALCDFPGLDDPDDDIREMTKTAMYSVNAIIYVINCGPMRDGGFSFTKQIVEDLKELGARMDRLFVVLNKIDLLETEQHLELEKYILTNLEKHNVLKYLPTAPIYLSAKNSFLTRVNHTNEHDSVKNLENNIWEFLLRNNKSGLHKLLGTYADLQSIINQLKLIIESQLLNSEKRKKLEDEITNVNSEITNLEQFVKQKGDVIYQTQKDFVYNSFQNILDYLQKDLNQIPLAKNIHDQTVITSWLKDYSHKVCSTVYDNLEIEINQLQVEINHWVSLKLNQVEIRIKDDRSSKSLKMPDLDYYTNQISYYFQSSNRKHPGILESILLGLEAFVTLVIESVESWVTSDAKQRNKQIKEVMQKATNSYKNIAVTFLQHLSAYLAEITTLMENKSIDRTRVYLDSLSKQLSKLDKSITLIEKRSYQQFLQGIATINTDVARNYLYLKEYTDGIKE